MPIVKKAHAVSLVKFSLGVVECVCGWVSTGSLTRTADETRELFARHRKEAGLPKAETSLAYGRGGWR